MSWISTASSCRTIHCLQFLLFLLFTALAPECAAQAVSVAEVGGVVADATGAAVPGAVVNITETEKHQIRTTNTDNDGRYVLPNLPVGPYELEVNASGFKTTGRLEL